MGIMQIIRSTLTIELRGSNDPVTVALNSVVQRFQVAQLDFTLRAEILDSLRCNRGSPRRRFQQLFDDLSATARLFINLQLAACAAGPGDVS